MFELAVLLSIVAAGAVVWFIYKERVADRDDRRIRDKTDKLDRLEKSVKRLQEEMKDV